MVVAVIIMLLVAAVTYFTPPLLYVFFVFLIRRHQLKGKGFVVNFLYLGILLGMPVLWFLGGLFSYHRGCESSVVPQILRQVPDVTGIYADAGSGRYRNYALPALYGLVRNGTYECIEQDYSDTQIMVVRMQGRTTQESILEKKDFTVDKPACARYGWMVTNPRPLGWLESPFHHVMDLMIYDRATGEVLATAREHLFGGPIFQFYMYGLSGGRDNHFRACGYLYKKSHAWRNSLGRDYLQADSQLTTMTLLPVVRSSEAVEPQQGP